MSDPGGDLRQLGSTLGGSSPGDTVAADELEPQLKYERLGADVKSILQDASATCLCLSEKVLALGTSAGNIHILDYSGNEVKRFSLHKQPVKHISFDDKAEYFASCCGDSYISISSLYADETTKFTFKRPITVVALEPRYASRKTREFVTGDVRGRLKLSSQGWLGRSDHVLHQGEGTIRAVSWHTSTLVWANEVGIKVYDTNTHQFVGSIKRPRGGRFADCFDCQLYLHEDDDAELLFVAWPDCIKVAEVLTHVDPISGAMSKTLHITASIPTDYFCMGAVPHGSDLAVLVYVTDADPDQDQVGLLEDQQPQPPAATAAAAHVQGGRQQQQQQQQQHKQQHEPGQLKMEPLPQQQQQQQPPPADAGQSDSASGAQPSVPGPINIPQPVKRPQRAANAFVRSPSGPSFLEAAAAAAVAGAAATAAATAAAGPVSTGSPTATPPRPAAEAVGEGASSSNSSPSPSKVMPSGGVGSRVQGSPSKPPAGAAAGAAGAAAASAVRPPAASYSRSGSAASRASSGDNIIITHTFVPPGAPLRPELRILSLTHKDSSSSGTTRHTHTPSLTAAAGEESKQQQPQQQQQLCSGCIEKASDALSVKGYQHYLPSDYQLVPSYGNELALLSSGGSQRKRSGSAAPGRKGRVSARSSGGGSSTRKEAGATGAAGGATQPGAVQGRDASAPPSPAKAPPGSKQQQQQVPAAAVSKDGAAAAEAAAAQPAHTENAAAAAAAATGCDVISADTAAAGEAVTGQQGPSGADVDAAGVAAVAGSETAPSAAAAAASSKDAVGAGAEEEVDELLAEDFGEFMYFIVSPQDIVIGRHRDVEDRISWCLSAGRFEAALSLAEADRNTRQEVWETVVQAYLESLTTSGRWSVAASMLPRLLKDQTALWERWVYTFAQARHLTLLAPVLPTRSPLLPSQDYDLVLQALLVDPVHHAQLLELVSTWPHAIFHPTKLIDAIAQRMQRPGGESRELWQALALLYKGQGRPDLSLAIYLQLQLPSVFDFIQENSLLLYLDQNAYLLMAIDEKRALELLTAHLDTLPPASVVPSLLDAMSLCESKGDEAERETWRHRLFNYLDRVFQLDPSAGGEYAELCVHLYADYCPSRLMDFLQGSQTYPLEAALEVAQQRGLIDEQVYVLSRMGNSRAALRLIIRNQQDIPRAIEFVRLQRDEELWEELIDWALSSADTTGQLLEHIGGNINPLRVIQKIPEGLAITRLRDRLRGIIADFRTQTSLREGCNAILRSDCLHLVQRLQREVKRALPTVWVQRLPSASSTAAAVAAAANAGADGIDTEAGTAAAIGAKAPVRAYPAAIGATGSSMDSSKGSAGFVPGVNAGKGPHWLKYQCGSGQPMEAASSQDVPAVAVRALAAAATAAAAAGPGNRQLTGSGTAGAGIGTLATLLAGATSGLASGSSSIPTISSSQPPHVWIGRTSGTDDTLGITSSGHDDGIMTDQQQPADGKAAGAAAGVARYSSSDQGGGRAGGIVSSSSSSSSHRTSRHHRQRSAGGVLNLPSLVAA